MNPRAFSESVAEVETSLQKSRNKTQQQRHVAAVQKALEDAIGGTQTPWRFLVPLEELAPRGANPKDLDGKGAIFFFMRFPDLICHFGLAFFRDSKKGILPANFHRLSYSTRTRTFCFIKRTVPLESKGYGTWFM